MIPAEFIRQKRDGHANKPDELRVFLSAHQTGDVSDAQMASWLMAVFLRGLNDEEIFALTEAMLHSGKVMDFSGHPQAKVDKHSTGGVGDKTSLILGPIVAAANIAVPMISGRGLGHTGGTLDKLESIPGFRTRLSEEDFRRTITRHGLCFMGQTEDICPADKKIYALRDVTGTVESIPLICASIMSKKLAEGIDALVLDVKFGSGAFMKTQDAAEALARMLGKVGVRAGLKMSALITSMEQPLGRWAGNGPEVRECLDILQGKPEAADCGDTRALSVELAGHMICLGGEAPTWKDGVLKAEEFLSSGKAFEKFEQVCHAQGGDLKRLPTAAHHKIVLSAKEGFIQRFDTESLGWAGVTLGAGRKRSQDPVDPTAGFRIHCKVGEPVGKGPNLD